MRVNEQTAWEFLRGMECVGTQLWESPINPKCKAGLLIPAAGPWPHPCLGWGDGEGDETGTQIHPWRNSDIGSLWGQWVPVTLCVHPTRNDGMTA